MARKAWNPVVISIVFKRIWVEKLRTATGTPVQRLKEIKAIIEGDIVAVSGFVTYCMHGACSPNTSRNLRTKKPED